jgi:Mg2+-importing ATPase
MGAASEDIPYWSQDPSSLMALPGASPAGLTSVQASTQLGLVGPNSVEDTPRLSALRLLLRQFESPLVLILAFAAVISLVLQQWVDAAIILAIVVGSSLLSFFQEYRASSAVEELKKRLALTARVLRDGVEREVPVRMIVPGDVVLLSAGNLIPADGLVIEAADFLVSEASMTGESFPVEKRPGIVAPDAPITQRTNSVFLGASVRSGTAKVLAVKTGRGTEFGAIAARLKARQPETDFGRCVRQFGYLLLRVMVVMVLFVLTVNLLLHRPVMESLLFAVALAVGLSPELLPAIISVTLSAGARAMSKRGVIVRRLDAIENLGSMDILCTDKTGTLTEGTLILSDVLDTANQPSDEVRQLAFLNAAFETGIENPLDAAIVSAGESAGLTKQGFIKIDEIPYDFMRRMLTIVVAEEGRPAQHLFVTKGAFANVMDICTSIDRGGTEVPLDAAARARLDAVFEAKGAEGFRVLALATCRVVVKADYAREDERDMVFRGFLIFLDPPKADARRTIENLSRLGIRIKVISGDNRHVTAHLAAAVGLDAKSLLTGEDLAKLKDEALWHLAPRTDLFVEIDPQQKERIIRALQRTGHSVGYLGDGINDASALHAADVGISVAEAVDVARESADIILLSRDLDVLRAGVEDGRRTFANTVKYIAITTSANFGNMISMALVTPLLPFLPLAAKQILLNNFLSDVPSIAISSDTVDPERVTRPQRCS